MNTPVTVLYQFVIIAEAEIRNQKLAAPFFVVLRLYVLVFG